MFLYVEPSAWRSNCPPLLELNKMLLEKARIAIQSVIRVQNPDGSYYYTVDAEKVRALHKKLFGKFQRVDESEPPPVNVYKRIVETVPGIIACMHARYYYEAGVWKNEVMSLEGPGGAGKSSYVYWLVKLIGGMLVNDAEDLVKALEVLLGERRWVPILVLDDIGAIISKYWFLSKEERKWSKIFRLLEYAKDFTGLILMTERNFSGIAKKLRELATLNGKLVRMLAGEYIIDYIKWSPPGSHSIKYLDVLWPGLRIDNRDWAKLIEKRREIGLKLLKEFKGEEKEEEEEE